jgi:hypothetical protein
VKDLRLKGEETPRIVFRGLRDFLSEVFRQSNVRVSTLLERTGLDTDTIEQLKQPTQQDYLIVRLCPELRWWLLDLMGPRQTTIIVDFHGLYGEEPKTIKQIAINLGIDQDHGEKFKQRDIRQLRQKEHIVSCITSAANFSTISLSPCSNCAISWVA